jgi:pimeloyl-ACP methyl ester carboxylesterase
MQVKLDRFFASLMLTSLLSLSCTANRMYRPVSVEEHPDYSLAFVEFDDQGELWAPSQLEKALGLLEEGSRSALGTALVLFVHGWNNSASLSEEEEGTGSIYRFRQILTRLHSQYQRRNPGRDFSVVGIYLGWRGEVSSVPLLRQLSFYNRRGAAERIAGATATEAIYRILTTARTNPNSRSVLIGHSFGSMILERALSQAVVSALLASPDQELIFPADLVVLANPAGSAIQTKQLVDMLARNRLKTYRFDEDGNRFERPLLLSFTSETDRATRMYFPLGMGVKGISKKFRTYGSEYCSPISNQKWLYSHTAGHTPALFSHEVTVGPKIDRSPGALEEMSEGALPPRYESEYDPLTQQVALSFQGEDYRFTIKRKPRALNDTPYWIMQVPRELIPNHSDIFTPSTFALVEAALGFSGALAEDNRTIVVREDGVRPVAIVPRPDGGALFLDRSRAVYAVGPNSNRPVFLTCMRESVDPDEAIGFHVAGNLAYAVFSHSGGGESSKCRTEMYEFEIEKEGYRQRNRIEVSSSDCFSTAAIDVPEKHLYLISPHEGGGRLLVADLEAESPRPRDLLDVPGLEPATAMFFEASKQRLFVAQGESGTLWELDLGGDVPELRQVVKDLGWIAALGYGKTEQRLYVTDARNQRIWALDCRDECKDPSVFLQSETLQNPFTLQVALDGTLWLGDLKKQTLMTVSPDGSVERTITSISGAASSVPVDEVNPSGSE